MKVLALRRVPPGDRWTDVEDEPKVNKEEEKISKLWSNTGE